jgi:hypothetical protein
MPADCCDRHKWMHALRVLENWINSSSGPGDMSYELYIKNRTMYDTVSQTMMSLGARLYWCGRTDAP